MLKGVSIYTISNFFGAGINFLILPVLSRYLLPSEYGLLSIYNTYASMLIPFIGIMTMGLINVEYYKMKDKKEFSSFFSSIQLLPIITCSLISIAVYFAPANIAELLLLPKGTSKYWVNLLVVIAMCSLYMETYLTLFVVQKKPALFATANFARVIIEVSLTLLFVVYFRMGWKGRVYSWFITVALNTVLGFIYFYQKDFLSKAINIKYIFRGIKFGAPLILYSLGTLVINQSDRLFIAKYVSVNEAGIYNMGYQFGTVLLIASNGFNYFFMSYLYERLENISRKKEIEIVKMGYITFVAMAVLLLVLSVSTPLIFKYFIDHKYAEGTKFVFWTGLSYFFWAIFNFFSGFIFFAKKSSLLAWLSIINVSSNIALNFLLIPRFGAIGASYATTISFFVNAVLIVFFVNRLYKFPWLRFTKNLRFSRIQKTY